MKTNKQKEQMIIVNGWKGLLLNGVNNASNTKSYIILAINLLIVLASGALAIIYINRFGRYPWGSDTYGHLYKANVLYDSIKSGMPFLNYDSNWYNGIQPFRYWAPIPYYILALLNLFFNNIFYAFNAFIFMIFIVGAIGWLLWGYTLKRQFLGLIFALLWFFVPNNIRVLFSEGNLPYVTVNSLLPFIFLFYYKTITKKQIKYSIALAFFMALTVLCHAMLAAMTGVSLFLTAIFDSIIKKRYYENFKAVIISFLGIFSASFWLYPALKGGILSLNQASVTTVMEALTYPVTISLNPFPRLTNIEIYYFGLSFGLCVILGLLMSTKNEKSFFCTSAIIFAGTSKLFLPILEKLPLNQLFWMSRFTSISIAFIVIGIMLWKSLRKSVLIFIMALMILDSAVSSYLLCFNTKFPKDKAKIIELAAKMTFQRTGMLDLSTTGSFPSYYLSCNPSKPVMQLYGWAWQGAATSGNIVMINTALENGFYGLMFDRALELGGDTLIIKKSLIPNLKSLKELYKGAAKCGYKMLNSINRNVSGDYIIYKYPVNSCFGTQANYKGLAIGAYASNIAYLFPNFQVGNSQLVDDYTFNELKYKKAIYLSGFKYKNKHKAENLIMQLVKHNVKVVIDATGMDTAMTGDANIVTVTNAGAGEDFLGIKAQPVTLTKSYSEFYYKNARLKLSPFPSPYRSMKWSTMQLSGFSNKESYDVENHEKIDYLYEKQGYPTFIGLNLPYYTFLTKDRKALAILENALGMVSGELPKRNIIKMRFAVNSKGNILSISADKKNTIIPLASLDAFKATSGHYLTKNSLIYITTKRLQLKIGYPYLGTGILFSIISIALIFIICSI